LDEMSEERKLSWWRMKHKICIVEEVVVLFYI